MHFTNEQDSIISNPPCENLYVQAAAGSGKTECMVHRIVHLHKMYNIPYQNMIIISFSRDSVKEFKDRMKRLVDGCHVSTIHSLCGTICNYLEVTETTQSTIDTCIQDTLEYLQIHNPKKFLLHNPQHIIVDEAQDCSLIQQKLIMYILQKFPECTATFVGDVFQSIYRFNGAKPDLFTKLKKDDILMPTSRTLTRNFRSTPQIVDLANIIMKNFTTRGLMMRSQNVDGPKPKLYVEKNMKGRIFFVVNEIRRLIRSNYASPKEIAVLFRCGTGPHIQRLEHELQMNCHIETTSVPIPDNTTAVTICTVHKAKGHGWKVVFFMDASDYAVPGFAEYGTEEFTEEFCIFYTAVTRARRNLYLVSRTNAVSRFFGTRIDDVQRTCDYDQDKPEQDRRKDAHIILVTLKDTASVADYDAMLEKIHIVHDELKTRRSCNIINEGEKTMITSKIWENDPPPEPKIMENLNNLLSKMINFAILNQLKESDTFHPALVQILLGTSSTCESDIEESNESIHELLNENPYGLQKLCEFIQENKSTMSRMDLYSHMQDMLLQISSVDSNVIAKIMIRQTDESSFMNQILDIFDSIKSWIDFHESGGKKNIKWVRTHTCLENEDLYNIKKTKQFMKMARSALLNILGTSNQNPENITVGENWREILHILIFTSIMDDWVINPSRHFMTPERIFSLLSCTSSNRRISCKMDDLCSDHDLMNFFKYFNNTPIKKHNIQTSLTNFIEFKFHFSIQYGTDNRTNKRQRGSGFFHSSQVLLSDVGEYIFIDSCISSDEYNISDIIQSSIIGMLAFNTFHNIDTHEDTKIRAYLIYRNQIIDIDYDASKHGNMLIKFIQYQLQKKFRVFQAEISNVYI